MWTRRSATFALEKPLQQRLCLRRCDAIIYLRGVVALRVRKHPRPLRHPARFGIGCAIIQPRDPRSRNRARHRSGTAPASHTDPPQPTARTPSCGRPRGSPASRHGPSGRTARASGCRRAPNPRPLHHDRPHRHLAARGRARASSSAIAMKDRKPRCSFMPPQILCTLRPSRATG